jgi:hypothetical protein
MHYEINVSKLATTDLNQKRYLHLFATAERSIGTMAELRRVYALFLQKFPVEEGYALTVTEYRETGTQIPDHEILASGYQDLPREMTISHAAALKAGKAKALLMNWGYVNPDGEE